jgi:hypothetical protein
MFLLRQMSRVIWTSNEQTNWTIRDRFYRWTILWIQLSSYRCIFTCISTDRLILFFLRMKSIVSIEIWTMVFCEHDNCKWNNVWISTYSSIVERLYTNVREIDRLCSQFWRWSLFFRWWLKYDADERLLLPMKLLSGSQIVLFIFYY